jgi:ABC-type transport system involved in cytochrome c biogenesis ATPase subunit
MIVSFSVSNFRSFSTEETFSLVASNRLSGSHDDHAVPIPDSKEKVLRAAVLYGANGAGKSNLFKTLRYLKSVALWPRKKKRGTRREPFRFGGPPDVPSSFDLQFIAEDRLYRFGFKLDDERIIEEWLFQVAGNRQKLLYERTTNNTGEVIINAEGLKGASDKLMALATIGGPRSQSFLATANVTLNAGDLGEDLSRVLTWLKDGLNLIGPDEPIEPLGHLLDRDSDFRSFAGTFLKSASTGVDHLEVVRKEIANDDPRVFQTVLRGLTDGTARLTVGDSELVYEPKLGDRVYQIGIQAAHEHETGKVVRLELADESDGTRRLLNLVPALHHLRTKGAVYFIDEIDRSLHPILVKEFLEFFLKSHDGGPGQIIVTTHESNLLDQELLRRDEIWFAEKDQTGATRLYSLLDFKVRNDLEIRKHYLQGRFGAVPFLGNMDNLLAKTDRSE